MEHKHKKLRQKQSPPSQLDAPANKLSHEPTSTIDEVLQLQRLVGNHQTIQLIDQKKTQQNAGNDPSTQFLFSRRDTKIQRDDDGLPPVQFVVAPTKEVKKKRFLRKTKLIQVADKDAYDDIKQMIKPDDEMIKIDDTNSSIEIRYNYNQLNEIYPQLKYVLQQAIPSEIKDNNIKATTRELFDLAYGDRQALADARQALDDLDAKSLQTMLDFDFAEYDTKFDEDKLAEIKKGIAKEQQEDKIKALLDPEKQNLPGLLVSEGHADTDSKKFIVDNIATLKSQGVTVIYIEHLRQDYQSALDEYYGSSSNVTEMPPMLEAFVTSSDQNIRNSYPYNLRGLLETAKKNQVEIKALDTVAASRDGNDGLEGRVRMMNTFAADKITKDTKRQQKFIALIGEAHAYTHENTKGEKGFAGIAQLLDTIAIQIDGDDVKLQEEEKSNRKSH